MTAGSRLEGWCTVQGRTCRTGKAELTALAVESRYCGP